MPASVGFVSAVLICRYRVVISYAVLWRLYVLLSATTVLQCIAIGYVRCVCMCVYCQLLTSENKDIY